MSERLGTEERRWLAKDCPDIDYAEDGDSACPLCDTHAGNLVATVERIVADRLADANARLAAVEALAAGLEKGDIFPAWSFGPYAAERIRAALHPDPSETP